MKNGANSGRGTTTITRSPAVSTDWKTVRAKALRSAGVATIPRRRQIAQEGRHPSQHCHPVGTHLQPYQSLLELVALGQVHFSCQITPLVELLDPLQSSTEGPPLPPGFVSVMRELLVARHQICNGLLRNLERQRRKEGSTALPAIDDLLYRMQLIPAIGLPNPVCGYQVRRLARWSGS